MTKLGRPVGTKNTPSMNRRISVSLTGRTQSLEHKEKIAHVKALKRELVVAAIDGKMQEVEVLADQLRTLSPRYRTPSTL